MWIVHRDLAAAWLEPVTLVDLTERDAFQTSGDRIMFCFSWAQRAEEFWAMKRCQWSWTNVIKWIRASGGPGSFGCFWQMPPIQPGYLACHSWNLMCHLFLERPSPTFLGQVDPLSLSCLLSHGFEEGPARRALRKTMNDTQVGFEGKKTWKRGLWRMMNFSGYF